MQAYNTNAAAWALAKYLYKIPGDYYMVPVGIAIGGGLVLLHRLFVHVSIKFELSPWCRQHNTDP